MPAVNVGRLSRQVTMLVDSAELRYVVGWQLQPESEDGACIVVAKLGGFSVKVLQRFPLTEQGWADAWSSLVNLDQASAQRILQLRAARVEATARLAKVKLAPPPPPRFPSSPNTRRQILNAIAKANEKYARPFDQGNIALASFIGTESWSDYGSVVLRWRCWTPCSR
jgi:hypothetical protein